MTNDLDLTGSLLIALPGMTDPRFAGSVVYLCDYSEKGAMGLIINKPAKDMSFAELLEQVDIVPSVPIDGIDVHVGGPVETGRGFVLHSGEYKSDLRSLRVTDEIALTPTLDVLEDIANGNGPEQIVMLLGYAGWGPGQLERELTENGWLTAPATPGLLFKTSPQQQWAAALELIGVSPAMLSGAGGSA